MSRSLGTLQREMSSAGSEEEEAELEEEEDEDMDEEGRDKGEEDEEDEEEEEQLEPKVLPQRTTRALRLNKVAVPLKASCLLWRLIVESHILMICSCWTRRSQRMRNSGNRTSLQKRIKTLSSRPQSLSRKTYPTRTSASRCAALNHASR